MPHKTKTTDRNHTLEGHTRLELRSPHSDELVCMALLPFPWRGFLPQTVAALKSGGSQINI